MRNVTRFMRTARRVRLSPATHEESVRHGVSRTAAVLTALTASPRSAVPVFLDSDEDERSGQTSPERSRTDEAGGRQRHGAKQRRARQARPPGRARDARVLNADV